jgi:ABC-type phosphate transport system auxiliary subunit
MKERGRLAQRCGPARAAREAALEARYHEQMELRLGLIRSDSEGELLSREARAAVERDALQERVRALQEELDAHRTEAQRAVARLQEHAMRRLMQLPVARALGAWKAAVDERRQLLRATQRLRRRN